MTTARQEIAPEGVVGVYHCISRCVRRAFLCGRDPYTGQSFEHRKQWVQDRLEQFSSAFAMDVFAFAVMSNHLHVVLRTRPDLAETWDDDEVARRWLLVFPKRQTKTGKPEKPSPGEVGALIRDKAFIKIIRQRLGSLSWFMRRLNETIARSANKEDGCKGRFWEGRFKCQVLLDETAMLTCMAYVDLNPIRAGEAASPEESRHTSVYARIKARQGRAQLDLCHGKGGGKGKKNRPSLTRARIDSLMDKWLFPLDAWSAEGAVAGPDIGLDKYLDLVDWTGRQLRKELTGRIPGDLEPILERLKIDGDNWVGAVKTYGSMFYLAAGRVESLRRAAGPANRNWFQGVKKSLGVFG